MTDLDGLTRCMRREDEDTLTLAYKHSDGRTMRLRLDGWGFGRMNRDGVPDPEQLENDERYRTIVRWMQRLAKRVMT